MRYSGIIKDDVNNGEGIGLTFFTQGCPHHCKGCQNPETWNPTGGFEYNETILNKIVEYFKAKTYATRLTLSGGDPICSPDIVLPLCKAVKQVRPDVTIWLYTGYIYEEIQDNPILQYVDVLIDGPFILEKRDITLPFRGSDNQRIINVPLSKEKGVTTLYYPI